MEDMAGLMQAMVMAAQGAQTAAETAAEAVRATSSSGGNAPIIRDETRYIDKPEKFNPKDTEQEQAQWDEWRHGFVNYVCAQDAAFVQELDTIDSDRANDYDMHSIIAETANRCRMMYFMFSSFVRGRPLRLFRVHERTRNGYAAWRDLLQDIEHRERGRGLALLVGLVSEEN